MLALSTQAVVMGATAQHKDEALNLVAQALIAQGFVGAGYDEALKQREAQANTYLGAGLAIPHGTLSFKDQVLNTGVVLVHFKEGVDWGEGNIVYVAVGIAAKSDEHLEILKLLARALGNDNVGELLKNAQTPEALVEILSGKPSVATTQVESLKIAVWDEPASDIETMLGAGVRALKTAGAVHEGFLLSVLNKSILQVQAGIACVHSDEAVISPAVAVVSAKPSLPNCKALAVLAGVPAQEVERVIDGLLNLKDTTNSQALKRELSVLFDINETKNANEYYYGEAVIVNRHGLHARPATALTKVAGQFVGEVLVATGDEWVSAKSLMKILSLGVGYGQTLKVKISQDPDEQIAKQVLADIVKEIKAGLGEEVEVVEKVAIKMPVVSEAKPPLERGVNLPAIVASKGLAVAQAYIAVPSSFEYERFSDKPEEQKERLKSAILNAKAELARLISEAKNADIAGIFQAHQALLEDNEIIQGVHARIEKGLSAEQAWHSEIETIAGFQASLDNPVFAERATDLKDVGHRVLANLCGSSDKGVPTTPYVLIKEDLLPSDVATIDEKVVAILTAVGGASSHGAIIARSLGVPALVGAGDGVLGIEQGEMVLVDAMGGTFTVAPNPTVVEKTQETKREYEETLAKARLTALEPAITTDGKTLEVAVNLGDVSSAMQAVEKGADGVGLLRTELVFMQHNKMPDETTQIADYVQVFDAMNGKPVVVRTLDVGGDKPLPYLTMKKEDNPFLGVRGIRLSLNRPELLRKQLIALIKASNHRPLAIMFPMVGQLDEWYKARAILDNVLVDHPHDNLQVGIMIEVPSAAILADKFAPLVDFFSIGTNDLVQYTLAIDRGHPVLSAQADGLDPSVLRLIDTTIKSAHAHGKWVGVCGELGSDNLAVPILLGLGVDELSVSSSQIALVKAQIRTLNFAECQTLAKQALEANNGQAVRELVRESGLIG